MPSEVAKHLRALAEVLLRNGESAAFKSYVEVPDTAPSWQIRPFPSGLPLCQACFMDMRSDPMLQGTC
jgi:hypothetical protein